MVNRARSVGSRAEATHRTLLALIEGVKRNLPTGRVYRRTETDRAAIPIPATVFRQATEGREDRRVPTAGRFLD